MGRIESMVKHTSYVFIVLGILQLSFLYIFQEKQVSKSMAQKYKLTYFNITGLGEPIRYILAYGNLDFEDVRIEMDDWDKVKPTTPWGKVPVLEFDGTVLTQSGAIGRFLAKQLKLTGSSDLDATNADVIVDTVIDFINALSNYYWDDNPKTKEPKLEPLQSITVPFYLTRLDKVVGANKGYFVNGQLTWADLHFIALSKYMEMMAGNMDFFSNYPNLKQLKEKVEAIPQIKTWIEKRPATI